MRLLTTLALLLALPPCVAAAQARKGAPRKSAPQTKAAAAPTVICIDPGHPSEVASGLSVQNGTTEAHVDWVVASKLREVLEGGAY